MPTGAHICYVTLPETSHLGATLALADKLAAAGHHVTYITIPDLAERVRARGHAAVTMAEDIFPLGTLRGLQVDPGFVNFLNILWRLRILRPSTVELLRGLNPDLVLVDARAWRAAIVAERLEIGVVIVSPHMSDARDDAVPPLLTTIVPGTRWAELRTRLAWMRRDVKRRWSQIKGAARQLLEPRTSDGDDLRSALLNHRGSFPRLRGFTELVLCPEAFELPRSRPEPGQFYVEACVDFARERGVIADLGDDPRPLVFAAFGVTPKSRATILRVAKATIEAFRARRHLRLLMSLPPEWVGDVDLPENVVVREVPQLQYLPRAALAICHAGLNSVKECVALGVPMVVSPISAEQPGNAARVVYHGLGVMVMPDAATAGSIGAAVDRVLGDRRIHERAQAMREVFAAAEREGRAVQIIEGRLPARARRPTG